METLEELLCKSVLKGDRETVAELLLEGANPNRISKYGKTALGNAAYIGNVYFVKLLIDATNSSKPNASKTRQVSNKRKIRHGHHDESMEKCKNRHDRTLKEKSCGANIANIGRNQGYFVCTHNEGSSSDEGRVSGLKQPVSSPSLPSSPLADLEWDEEMKNVAPTTKEDENWTSLYLWYAKILECTGAVIEVASSVTNGIDQQDGYGRTALHWAVQQGHIEVVKLLIDAGCKLDLFGADGLTALHVAVIGNKLEIAEMLLQNGCQVNSKTEEKMTPLHFSAARGFLEPVKLLVRHKANIEARNSHDRTALYLATARGHLKIVQFLIRAGANVNGEELHGYTPLCEAVWEGNVDIVDLLLAAGARITHTHRLLHYAVIEGHDAIIHKLVNHSSGGGINLHDKRGYTPLLAAIKSVQIGSVLLLLDNGANPNICNSITGANALHVAVESVKCPKVFQTLLTILLNYKIDMNAVSLSGDTALNRALNLECDDAAWLLIRHGADVNIGHLNLFGLNNLSLACRRDSRRLANMLLKAGHYPVTLDSSIPLSNREDIEIWAYFACKHPLSLSDLCRIKIRNIGTKKILFRFVEKLPLPRSVKRYLMMEEDGAYYTSQ